MHKLFVLSNYVKREFDLKKLLKSKNIYFKSVNNHKTQVCHKLWDKYHILSKGYKENFSDMLPIYQDLDNDFTKVDLMDLNFYERWLNV